MITKSSSVRAKGKITSWNDEKGYGFIEPLGGGKRLFIHISAFANINRRPEENQIVTYALSTDNKGRPCAVKATLAGNRLSQTRKNSSGALAITVATIFLLIVAIAVLTSKVPLVILVIYLVASLVTFVAYALDKSAAKKGNWRTPENTLHILSLLGGWPGALVAQQKLRHKSKKQSFRMVYWLTVTVNCGVLVWLLTPGGAITLRSLLAMIV